MIARRRLDVDSGEPWEGLAVRISQDRAVVSAEGAQLMVHLLGVLERIGAREGGRLSPAALSMRDTFASLSSGRASSSGHGDIPEHVAEADWRHPSTTVRLTDKKTPTAIGPALSGELIGTTEAGAMLGVTRRHASRLAEDGVLGPTEKAGGRTLVYRSEVEAYAEERQQSR